MKTISDPFDYTEEELLTAMRDDFPLGIDKDKEYEFIKKLHMIIQIKAPTTFRKLIEILPPMTLVVFGMRLYMLLEEKRREKQNGT